MNCGRLRRRGPLRRRPVRSTSSRFTKNVPQASIWAWALGAAMRLYIDVKPRRISPASRSPGRREQMTASTCRLMQSAWSEAVMRRLFASEDGAALRQKRRDALAKVGAAIDTRRSSRRCRRPGGGGARPRRRSVSLVARSVSGALRGDASAASSARRAIEVRGIGEARDDAECRGFVARRSAGRSSADPSSRAGPIVIDQPRAVGRRQAVAERAGDGHAELGVAACRRADRRRAR